jgi:predicted 3-demethylubiquinone-9 3-methyltransferase (glyoxalase superfamily)
MQTCLWFKDNADEAAKFYTGLFTKSKLGKVTPYGDAVPGFEGKVMSAEFEIDGQAFLALNVGQDAASSPSVSFMINCDTQSEIDKYWDGILNAGGKELACGWITDQFGFTWQIVPTMLGKVMTQGSAAQRDAVMKSFMTMKKYDIATLEAARDSV